MSKYDSDEQKDFFEDEDFVEEKPLEFRPYKTDYENETIQIKLIILLIHQGNPNYYCQRYTIPKDAIYQKLEKSLGKSRYQIFSLTFKFSYQETSERTDEIKTPDKDLLQLIKNKVIEIGIKRQNPFQDASAQTVWNRKINKALQEDEGDEKQEQPDEDFKLLQFLETVYPLMEKALQSNRDQNAEHTNVIKEIKNFSCLNFKKSFVDTLLFEEKTIYQLKSHLSLDVFWILKMFIQQKLAIFSLRYSLLNSIPRILIKFLVLLSMIKYGYGILVKQLCLFFHPKKVKQLNKNEVQNRIFTILR